MTTEMTEPTCPCTGTPPCWVCALARPWPVDTQPTPEQLAAWWLTLPFTALVEQAAAAQAAAHPPPGERRMRRAPCPECGADVALTPRGRLRKHRRADGEGGRCHTVSV